MYAIVIEVARRAGNRKAEGQALQNIGNSAYFQRDFASALDAYRRRLAVEQDAANDEGVAESFVGIATVQYARFEYADALATYREAAAIQERLADGNALGTTLLSTGNVLFIQADYEGALADYRRSRDLLHKAFNFGSEARAAEGLGRAYAAQGDFAAALEAFDAVLTEVRAHGTDVLRGNATQNIGDVHFRLGNLEAARAAFDESRVFFEAARDQPSIGRAWQAIALTDLVATRFAAAEQEYTRSMAACAPVNDRECVARATVGLAFAQSSQEHFDEAVATYRKAIDAFAALNRPGEGARAEVGLSQAYLGRKDFDLARQAATRAREAAAGLSADDVLWRAITAEARAWRRLGSPDRAMAAAHEAVAIVQRIAECRRSQSVEACAARHPVGLCLSRGDAGGDRRCRRAPCSRSSAATPMRCERRSARNEREIWRGATDDEREDERTLSAAVASVSAQLDQEAQLPRSDPARIQMLSARLTEAIAARSARQQRIYERLPDLRRWRGLVEPPPVEDLLAAVSPAATIVEMAIDDDDVVGVTVAPGDAGPTLTASVRGIRRQALAESVAALTPDRLRDPDAWRTASAEVAAHLPEPVLAALRSARVALVIPDGVLWRVPFEALPAGTGLVGESTTITYAASLMSLRAPRRMATSVDGSMLAVAAPALDAGRIERIQTTAPGWVPRPADEAQHEIERLAPLVAGTAVLSGRDASEAAVRARLPAAALLHVAAPLRVNGASPLFSRVYLSGAAAPGSDGADDAVLDAREVFNLNTGADLAVFTDGAAGAMRDAASGWVVVQWAWRAAGVPRIVAARWSGDGAAADELLGEFYARVMEGDSAAAALHAAQEKVRARKETRAPWFWAGWMLIGG